MADRYGEEFPGTMGDTLITETNQRDFDRRWQALILDDGTSPADRARPTLHSAERSVS